ncbi:hypothetical protein Pyn_33410 [Prunus yedoensis var. nudiflora]|uniref:Uncharacterized protein n=1 Tax=Prunus yedoensis var. nudiflora TaxID=2094558 RepID=A0A314YAH0_PRUYE|nr:hypothetical protein Pyn_33410 [Prunus yedoensis var. nudiflora]
MKVEYAWKLVIVCGFIIASVTYVCSFWDKHKRKNKQSKRAIKDGGMVIMAGVGAVLATAATAASGDVPHGGGSNCGGGGSQGGGCGGGGCGGE